MFKWRKKKKEKQQKTTTIQNIPVWGKLEIAQNNLLVCVCRPQVF